MLPEVLVQGCYHFGGGAWLRGHHLALTERAMQWPDALGLGLFAASGTQIALAAHMPPLIAVLMGVVLAKLVFVDRQHLGNLLGIGSFIGYGLLCTVVGYLAPAPPRRIENEEAPA